METQTRPRPELPPVWTGRDDQPLAYPRAMPQSAISPLFSASASLPSPIYPASPGHDAMRAHERALVDRLDRVDFHGRRESQLLSPTAVRSLSPISEQKAASHGDATRRVSVASLTQPTPSPQTPSFIIQPHVTPQTIAAQTREILMEGVPDNTPIHSTHPRLPLSLPLPLPQLQPPSPINTSIVDGRRPSLPPLSPASPWQSSAEVRQQLRSWGRLYFNNISTADCLVTAVSLRRYSDSASPLNDKASPLGEGEEEEGSTKDLNQNLEPSSPVPPSPFTSRQGKVAYRVLVRPFEPNRRPFFVRREFDMDGLRSTIPDPGPPSAPASTPASAPMARAVPTSVRSHGLPSHGLDAMDRSAQLRQSTNTVPIHLKYAKSFLPALAALLYSGHIRHKRDTIDLPLPHPAAWAHTVAYLYTGRGGLLTDAVRENILYLGGKV
ncbi:uncharacterized protein C8A04DRAFT_11187 [Dichotomopilus funicola]|uniref:Uncharacterized protein n=1 Tax=Dichotomopilus funicola TaxID=1934379 RepID=A0AAN6V5D8_9PEZI|nr:hypothetical protein C8A04DRAFT_11187 [Dichotomopilus funicola]